MFSFGERSLNNLKNVHPDLVLLMKESIKNSPYDFAIIEGRRSPERQRMLYNEGKSKTLLGRHIEGMAIDFMAYTADGKGTWEHKYYRSIVDHIKLKAAELKTEIICGLDWRSFVDGPHVELDRRKYPGEYKE